MIFSIHFLIYLINFAFASKNNILMIVVDDLRPALGCYQDANAHTPNIDSLAKKSIIFNNAFSQQAICAPSRNSFLTSRRPDTLHLYDFYSYWRNFVGNFTTLPQHFKENGYHTMSIGKVFHPGISSNWSDDQPYSWSEPPFHPSTEQFKEAAVCPTSDGQFKRNLVCPVTVTFQPGQSLPDLQSMEAAQAFLQQASRDPKPFFLAVGFHKPHVPLKFPRQYLDFHPLESVKMPIAHDHPSSLPNVAWNPWTDVREREDVAVLNISFPFGLMPDNYTLLIRQSYYAAVTYIDDLVGQLLGELAKTGNINDTIILLLGDHGWSLSEHGEWSKFSNYEVSVRVPFILHVPGLTDTSESSQLSSNALVELVDVFPTLVELTNVTNALPLCPPNSSSIKLCTEGLSIVPLIQQAALNKILKRKTTPHYFKQNWKSGAFSQYPRPGPFPTLRPNSDKPRLKQIHIMGYSLRTLRHRYTEWIHFDAQSLKPDWSEVIAKELYDHKLDPNEDFNLADRKEMSEVIGRLSKQLQAGWRYSLPKFLIKWQHMHLDH